MYNIVVRPTCIIINNYKSGDSSKLENCFRKYNMVTHSFTDIGMFYDEENERLFLPRGIDLWWVQNTLNVKDVTFEEPDEFDVVDDIMMKYQPRDDVQKECLRFMLGVSEYQKNNNFSQLSVNLNTGKGKSYVSIYTMAYTKIKSIIVTYSNGWLDQWRDYITEYTNLENKDIHKIAGAPGITMLLSGKTKYANSKVYLVTHATIKSYGDTYGWDKIRELFKILKIGQMFIDEAHLNFTNICMISFFTNVYKTYYVTATPARSDKDENRVYQLSMKNIPSIDLFDPEKDPHTNYIAMKWSSKPTPQQVSDCKNAYGLDRNKYVNYVVNKPNFYKMLRVIMDLVIKFDGRALFYIGTNDAILKVYKWMNDNYPEFISEIGIYTTLVGNDKEIEKGKKLILSTTKSAGAAEHIEGLKMTIVLAEPFKSEVLARQTLGRTRDDDTYYIELVDLGFYKIKQYYYEKLPVFNKYAVKCSDVNISQEELDDRAYRAEINRQQLVRNCPFVPYDNRFEIMKIEPIHFEFHKRSPLIFYDHID